MENQQEILNNINEFNKTLAQKDAFMVYFSHEKCNVCKVLKPKITKLLQENYPKLEMIYCDTAKFPELAAQNRVFTVPTLLVYFRGKEYFRKIRNISINELSEMINRPYEMIFAK